jgi:hypothetical protein
MALKKILILSLTLLSLPLFILINQVDNNDNNPEKINKIVKNLYLCYDLPREQREKCSLLSLNTNLSLAENLSIIKKIDKDIELDKKIKNLCHDITHIIGTNAYNNHKDNSLIPGYESCGQGYYHGIMSEILLKKANGTKLLTQFCADTSNNLIDIGLCYHGIGHTLINQISSTSDKDYINKLTTACSKLNNLQNINETKNSLHSKKSYASENEIIELLVKSCFLGGFDEYMNIKITSLKYNNNQIDIKNCENIDIIFIKDCHAILYQYILSEQILDTNLTLDEIYIPFAEKCNLLTTANQVAIKIKEGCFKAIPRSYINTTLMRNIKYKDREAPNLLDLNIDELYNLISKICLLDYNNSCKLWFLTDIEVKLIPNDYSSLLSRFEKITSEDLRNLK